MKPACSQLNGENIVKETCMFFYDYACMFDKTELLQLLGNTACWAI